MFRTKAVNADHHLTDTGLRRVLGPVDLTLLGIGAIIGAGIFVLTGVAAATKAGPAITLSYLVAGALTGSVPYPTLNVGSPVADALLRLGHRTAAALVAAGAIAGLTTVMLVLYYGLTRVLLAMSRDGLLPPLFARVHPRTHTPVPVIVAAGLLIASVAGLTPIGQVAELVNIGTLAAFFLVSVGVIVLRQTHPDLPRPFRVPFSPLVPLLGAGACLVLALSLPAITWLRFGLWLAIGLVIYTFNSRHHSALATPR